MHNKTMGKKYKKSLNTKEPLLRNTHRKPLGPLFALIHFALMGLLGAFCVKGAPLWLITIVLLLNIGFLIFCILYDTPIGGNTRFYEKEIRNNRIKLLRWGFGWGLMGVGAILLITHWDLPLFSSPTVKNVVSVLCMYLGYKYREKNFW